MTLALYSTIWLALGLFAAAEATKQNRSSEWAWRLWIAGAFMCTIHILIAFAGRYGWSHDAAIRETARQTAAVYGINWGGGVYVNYLFVGLWLMEGWWWRTYPRHYFARPAAITWTIRAFFIVIIANAGIVFAHTPGRAIGIAVVAVLLWAWRPDQAR